MFIFNHNMNIFALIQGVNAALSGAILTVVLLKKQRTTLDWPYIGWIGCFFLWTATYSIWGFVTDKTLSLAYLHRLLDFTAFIHVTFFHFTLVFSNTYHRHKLPLFLGYGISVFLIAANWAGLMIDTTHVTKIGPFNYWPKAGPLLWLYISIEVGYVLYSFKIMSAVIPSTSEPLKSRLKIFLLMSILAWIGGIGNWLYFFDITFIPPYGNLLVTGYMIITYYLLFRHDLLGMDLAIKRTFVYGLLTLFITLVYIMFVLLSERFFQNYLGYRSVFITILAALTITLLFNPLRSFLFTAIETYLYGAPLERLSLENSALRSVIQKQDHMRALATLAAGMAHEIKNPLTSIRTFAEYLPDKYNDKDFRLKFQHIVIDEVDRINDIIKQLLEFARPKDPVLRATRLSSIMDEILELLSNNFLVSKISLIRNYGDERLVLADATLMKQVFLNLCLNGIQAMPTGGQLTIGTQAKQGYQIISLTDTGVGIPAGNLNRLFDPFFTTKESGTGLGLSIVHGIIREHKGAIDITSKVGVGTTVTIKLPHVN